MDRIWYFYDKLREEESVSFTPLADHDEYVHAEKLKRAVTALKDAAAWVAHWDRDRENHLVPTSTSLAKAACEIKASLEATQ